MVTAERKVPVHIRKSLTWDRGIEMAEHDTNSKALGMPVFFCEPASPWQRPTNEKINGLLRKYLPKETDLSVHEPAELRRVQRKLNHRPRKALKDRSAAETHAALTAILDPHCRQHSKSGQIRR